jgi:hypothetical protein
MRAALFLALMLAACGGSSASVAKPTGLDVAAAQPPSQNDPTASHPTPDPDLGKPAQGAPQAAPSMPATTTSAAEAPKKIGARHVLVQWMGSDKAPASVVRTKDQAHAVAEEVLKRARGGEDLARLAVEFSDEPGAGPRGGSLGRFGKGSMVPAFEEAAFRLKVGEISEIVETGFGYHIIQRTE